MGMFDNIIIDANILPDLTQEEKSLLNETKGWQTKDFENILTDIHIVEDQELKYKHSFVDRRFPYKLQIKESDWEELPLDQRLHSDVSPIITLAGSIRETNVRIVDLNYTGTGIEFDPNTLYQIRDNRNAQLVQNYTQQAPVTTTDPDKIQND
jgi:hypothetical protein